jgi:hypothetical protein
MQILIVDSYLTGIQQYLAQLVAQYGPDIGYIVGVITVVILAIPALLTFKLIEWLFHWRNQ